MIPNDDQIRAILSMDVWHWGLNHLPDGKTFDDIRFRDLITVSENDVFNFVTANGFNERVVAERDAARWADDQLCIVPEADGRGPSATANVARSTTRWFFRALPMRDVR